MMTATKSQKTEALREAKEHGLEGTIIGSGLAGMCALGGWALSHAPELSLNYHQILYHTYQLAINVSNIVLDKPIVVTNQDLLTGTFDVFAMGVIAAAAIIYGATKEFLIADKGLKALRRTE